MGKPISVYRLSVDSFICPVSNVESLLCLLMISFFMRKRHPFDRSVDKFSEDLDHAGIAAPKDLI